MEEHCHRRLVHDATQRSAALRKRRPARSDAAAQRHALRDRCGALGQLLLDRHLGLERRGRLLGWVRVRVALLLLWWWSR